MGAVLEVKYFNTFWLKKIKAITDVTPDSTSAYVSNSGTTFVIGSRSVTQMNVGQKVTFTYTSGAGDTINYSSFVSSRISDTSFVAGVAPDPAVTGTPTITFGSIINFDNIPSSYASNTTFDWYEEEARIRGGYNNLSVDFGVKAYLVEDNPVQQHRISTLIYSGLFNSRTGVNNTNEFSVGTDITKSADPANGSIQKLYSEDTNLIIFQENKVSRALIDKDAIYSAEGSAAITSSPLVIGQIVAYAGEYGISTNPESFAVYGFRKYFTDKARGCVLRLSRDGITEISSYGMHDFFRDELAALNVDKIVGSWDNHTKNYNLSIQKTSGSPDYKTLCFDEGVLGWTSFLSYKPSYAFSLNNLFYTFNTGQMYQHYLGSYGKFYGITYGSDVTIVLNSDPSVVKVFETINYEGASGWELESMIGSSGDVTLPIGVYQPQTSLAGLEGALFSNNFKRKNDKYFANLINNSPATQGEILFGASMTGIKGFFSTVKLKVSGATQFNTSAIKKELFSVASNIVESSY